MEAQKKLSLPIDLRLNTMIPLPQFIQNDTNILEFTVKDNGVDADLSNITRIVVNYKRLDKKVVSRLLTATGNTVLYEVGLEEMEVPGPGELELQFYENEKRISTKRFKVNMLASIGTDAIYENTEQMTVLQELFVEVDTVKAETETARNNADAATEAANTAAANAQQVADENRTRFLPAVASIAARDTSYPTPAHGDTVRVTGESKTYRYDSVSGWVVTDQYNPTAIDQINADLAEKANEIEVRKKAVLITEADISTELKQQILGTTPINAVPGDNTVNAKRMYNGQLGANLLDLNDITPNFYVDPATGNLLGSSSYSVSNYIAIKPSTTYGVFGNSRVAFYDANKTFISGVQARTFTSPANAAYIRVSIVNSTLSSHFLLENTNTPNQTIPYWVKLPWLRVEKDNILSLPKITMNDIEGVTPSTNLYNKTSSKDGYYLDTVEPNLGREAANSSYTASAYIPVDAVSPYTFTKVRHYVFFDKYKIALSAGIIDVTNQTITTPTNAAFVRISILTTNKDTGMLVKGSAAPASFVPYGGNISWFSPPKSKYHGKTMVNFGDSITASIDNASVNNYGSYIADSTGVITINQGYSSGRMGYNSANTRNFFSMHKLADAIVSGNFTEQENALTGLDPSNVDEYTAQLNKLKAINFNTVDFVSIALGTNDWYGSISPIDNVNNPYDVNNYFGATRYSIKKLQEVFPHLKFLLMTPIFRFNVPDTSTGVITEYSDTWKVNGYTLKDMAAALKAVGNEMNVPVVDMYHELGINKHNCVYWFESLSSGVYDGTHPNVRTKELMGRKVAGALLSKY